MLRNRINVAVVTALAAIALSSTVLAQGQAGSSAKAPAGQSAQPAGSPGASGDKKTEGGTPELATVAIDRAAKANRYAFVFFYRIEDEATKAARKVFDEALQKLSDRAVPVIVNVADPLDRPLVAKYGMDRAPTPVVLALAPNGAVTRGFGAPLAESQFESAFVSPCSQKCLKALQDRKLVFVCVQNDKTQHNAEVMKGVNEFAADEQQAKTTEIVKLDPADSAEESFLTQLKVDPKTEEAVVVFMAPPGSIVGTYKGETKKDLLVAAAKTAAKGCDPKSGCCPAPKKPAEAPQPKPAQPGSTGKKP